MKGVSINYFSSPRYLLSSSLFLYLFHDLCFPQATVSQFRSLGLAYLNGLIYIFVSNFKISPKTDLKKDFLFQIFTHSLYYTLPILCLKQAHRISKIGQNVCSSISNLKKIHIYIQYQSPYCISITLTHFDAGTKLEPNFVSVSSVHP